MFLRSIQQISFVRKFLKNHWHMVYIYLQYVHFVGVRKIPKHGKINYKLKFGTVTQNHFLNDPKKAPMFLTWYGEYPKFIMATSPKNGYQPPGAPIAQKINFSKYVHIIYDFVAFLILIIFYKKISENKPERTYLPRV